MKQQNGKYSVPALQKAIAIVQAVAAGNDQIKMRDLLDIAGCSKSHLYALLSTLCGCGWLTHNNDHTFSIGDTLVMHGTMRLYPLELVRHFHTEFFNVKSELNFVFQLSILEGTEIIYLAKAQLGETVKIATFPGMRMPAHCTAMGKVFLSQYGKDSLLCMYPNRKLEKITPSTVANVEDLWLQLCEFKKSGFIIEVGETKTGYSCVAAAVRNAFGRITAAVSMTTLTPYPSREHEEASVVIREFCDHISAKLGYASGKDDPV